MNDFNSFDGARSIAKSIKSRRFGKASLSMSMILFNQIIEMFDGAMVAILAIGAVPTTSVFATKKEHPIQRKSKYSTVFYKKFGNSCERCFIRS